MRLSTIRLLSAGVAVWLMGSPAGSALGQSYVYPAHGQSPQQQQKDQGECHVWATQQSGVNPAPTPPPPSGPQGQMARGAAAGAVGGAIAGDAGKGAAIGAASS